MKQVNGTITLSFVEEDNKQRVIFRIVPLCTREGITFHDGKEAFPDVGSLRVVPDKREQSTFKERMRGMGSFCAVVLSGNEGKELAKVRQNRNYAPAQGECNQFAIYSDVICEFTEDALFEVLEYPVQTTAAPLTPRVLLHANKMLYGPVDVQVVREVEIENLKPFGNDHFLLHTVEVPEYGARTLYWNPESTLNWRQRRGMLRRKGERDGRALEAEMTDSHEVETVIEAEQISVSVATEETPVPRERRRRVSEEAQRALAERAEESSAPQAEAKPETALPIGTRLNILDVTMPFEEQISRLEQPLSDSANRLGTPQKQPVTDVVENPNAPVRFAGTPLVRSGARVAKAPPRTGPLHQVVEQQLKIARDERFDTNIPLGALPPADNPIENLSMALDAVWQEADLRRQAVDLLVQNQALVDALLQALHNGGRETHAAAAARAQLEDIEAERLSVLMQLDMAKNERKRFQDQAVAGLMQKKRDEIDRLNRNRQALKEEQRQLEETTRALSMEAGEQAAAIIAARLESLCGIAEAGILISPVVGAQRGMGELVEALRIHMSNRGYGISEDEAVSLFISFALFDALCLRARTLADAQLFATTMLEAFGLQSVSSTVRPGVSVEIINLLKDDEHRTPTVTLQILGTEALNAYGHKTIYLADESMDPEMPEHICVPYPVIQAPELSLRAKPDVLPPSSEPAALSGLHAVVQDGHALLSEGEAWFAELKEGLKNSECGISESALYHMHRFVSVASRKVRGGFLAAADTAACQWLVPQLMNCNTQNAQLLTLLRDLPRTQAMLRTR